MFWTPAMLLPRKRSGRFYLEGRVTVSIPAFSKLHNVHTFFTGRHVFTTLQHLADIQKRRTGKFVPKIHFTLIDIHPAAVARIIVVLALLEEILRAKKEGDTDKVVLLHTTINYVYNTSLMPEYCQKLCVHDVLIDRKAIKKTSL